VDRLVVIMLVLEGLHVLVMIALWQQVKALGPKPRAHGPHGPVR